MIDEPSNTRALLSQQCNFLCIFLEPASEAAKSATTNEELDALFAAIDKVSFRVLGDCIIALYDWTN